MANKTGVLVSIGVVTGIVLLGFLFSGAAKHDAIAAELQMQTQYEIVSISLTKERESSGGFFLIMGSYSSGEETYFYFYARNGKNGGIKLNKVERSQVVIFEDSKGTPYLNQTEDAEYESPWATYYLHIPPNSIAHEVNVGLENIN